MYKEFKLKISNQNNWKNNQKIYKYMHIFTIFDLVLVKYC